MFCSKCGIQNTVEDKFCKNCGTLLNNDESNKKEELIQESVATNNEINEVVNPDTKKYALISIAIGAGGIVFAFLVGISLWLSLILSSLGISFAKKTLGNYKGLTVLGYVLNIILLILGIIVYISILVEGM